MADMAGLGNVPLIPEPIAGSGDRSGLAIFGQGSPAAAATREPHPVAASRHAGDILLRGLSLASATGVLLLFIALIGMLLREAWPSITSSGFSFFTRGLTGEIPVSTMAGIVGTVYCSFLALIMAAPVGVLIAIFLSEMSPAVVKRPLGFMVELLAAIPSIVYGLWGLFFLIPQIIQPYVNPFLVQHFGGFFLFGDVSGAGEEYLTAGIVLAVMILPTIAAISRDVIATVPASHREAMLALGATRWETTWRVVVPTARSGIIGAILLGLGRAVGETMAVVMVLGGSQSFGWSVLHLGTTLPATIVSYYLDAGGPWLDALMEMALILLIISIALNALARMLVWTVNRRFTA